MAYFLVLFGFLFVFSGGSTAFGNPTIKQCEPELSSFLEIFGKNYEIDSVVSNPANQYECQITETSAALSQRDNWVFVDTRSRHDFEKLHIPASLNVSSNVSRAISHLKTRNILLVNKGSRSNSAMELCRELKAKGYTSVSVLADGINGWVTSGGSFNGSATGRRELFFLNAQEVAYLLNRNEIKILYVEALTKSQKPSTILRQFSSALSSLHDSEILLKLSELQESSNLPVLMVGDGTVNESLIDRYIIAKNAQLYFIESGAGAFERFYQDWKNSLASKSATDSADASCF